MMKMVLFRVMWTIKLYTYKMLATYVAGETRHIGLLIKVKAIAQPPFSVEGYQEVKATDVFYINYNTLFCISIKDTFRKECFNQVGNLA